MNKNLPPIDFAPESTPMRRTMWLIFMCAFVIVMAFVGDTTLSGQEGYLAEGARRMLAGRDIFAADCWWQPNERMPLWFCRVIMLPAALFGSSEFACRLLSIASAFAVLGGTMALAGDFFNRRAEACAAWMLIGSYGFIYWSRFAGSFMFMAAWVIWLVILLRHAQDRFWWRSLCCFMVFTATAWWGMLFILLVPGILVLTFDRCGKPLGKVQTLWAMLPALAVTMMILLWQVSFPGIGFGEYFVRLWRQLSAGLVESWNIAVMPGDNLWRWVRTLNNLPRLLLPWTLPVLVAVAGMLAKWRELSADQRRLLAGTLLMFILTGIFPGRRWQYLLNLLPFFLIIGAAVTAECVGMIEWNRKADRVMWWVFCLGGSLAAAVIVTWPLWQMIFWFSPPLWIMFGVPFLGVVALCFLIFDTGSTSMVERISGMNGPWSGYILAGVALTASIFVVAVPALDDYRSGRAFWETCGNYCRDLSKDEVIYYGSFPNAKHLYYMELPSDCSVVYTAEEFAALLPRIPSGEASLIVKRGDFQELKQVMQQLDWILVDDKPALVEAGMVNGNAGNSNNKYILCRIRHL